jgi:hypothetical protein
MTVSRQQQAQPHRAEPRIPPINWAYGFCETHVSHPSRAAAKRAVRHHLAYPCWKCDLGRRIDWFVCPVASTHLHIGHGPLKESAS